VGMKKMIFFVWIIAFISCNKQNNENKNLKVDEIDIQHLREAYCLGLYFINITQIAQSKATSNEVKDLAKRSLLVYKQINNDLIALANKRIIHLQSDINEKQKTDIQKLLNEEGTSFDKKMVSEIRNGNMNALSIYQELYVKSQDEEISYWALNKLSRLHDNFEYAVVLQKKLKIK
jgi:predicted outer membrane protein